MFIQFKHVLVNLLDNSKNIYLKIKNLYKEERYLSAVLLIFTLTIGISGCGQIKLEKFKKSYMKEHQQNYDFKLNIVQF